MNTNYHAVAFDACSLSHFISSNLGPSFQWATKRVFWWPFGRKYRKKLFLLILGLSVFQQKDPISADIASFYRNHLFRFFRYFGRKSLFGDALFWLSADRRTFSLFCHPLLYSKYVSGEPCIRLGHYASAFPSQLTISSWAGANTPHVLQDSDEARIA